VSLLGAAASVAGGLRGEQGGLHPKIGNAGHARAGSWEVVLRGAVGLGTEMFLMVKELAFGVDQSARAEQLRQRDAQERGGLFQELSFAQSQLFEYGDFESFEEGSAGLKGQRARPVSAVIRFAPAPKRFTRSDSKVEGESYSYIGLKGRGFAPFFSPFHSQIFSSS
jgi:hypothetical protein